MGWGNKTAMDTEVEVEVGGKGWASSILERKGGRLAGGVDRTRAG